MYTSRKLLIVIILTVLALSGGAAWSLVGYFLRPERPEYVAAPFPQVDKNYPRILAVREWPHGKDASIQRQFLDERARIRKYLKDEGAICRASDQERQAYHAVLKAEQKDDDGFVKARDLAGKLLDADPKSVIGHFVMAKVEHEGEANLARALFQIRQARHLLETRGQEHPDDADAREWYILVLDEEYRILGDMDRREEQLQVVDLLEQVYQPMPWLRLFPLIKQKKLEDVARLLDALEKQGGWTLRVLNTRNMVAEQTHDRHGQYKTGKRMVETISNSGVLWNNFGLSCVADFRLEEAEKAYVRAAALNVDFVGSSYFRLTGLYLQQGRFAESLQAIKQGQVQRGRRKPYTFAQDQTMVDQSLATLMLALGRGPDADRFARRSFERPGRLGNITVQEREDFFAGGFLLWLAMQTRTEQIQEGGSDWQALLKKDEHWPGLSLDPLRMESWGLQQKLLKILGDEKFLSDVLRPNLLSESSAATWAQGSILRLLPAGIAEEALARARRAENHAAAVPYFDVMAAELALSRGRPEAAGALIAGALEKLPPIGEKLLRARAAAIGSEAAFQTGRHEDSRALAQQALRDFPQVFRMLSLRVGVSVQDDGTPLARRVKALLLHSPRFRPDADGFQIRIRRSGDKLVLAMLRNDTNCHVQFDFPINAEVEFERTASAACVRFHERMLSPALDLTAIDINALDQLPRPRG